MTKRPALHRGGEGDRPFIADLVCAEAQILNLGQRAGDKHGRECLDARIADAVLSQRERLQLGRTAVRVRVAQGGRELLRLRVRPSTPWQQIAGFACGIRLRDSLAGFVCGIRLRGSLAGWGGGTRQGEER